LRTQEALCGWSSTCQRPRLRLKTPRPAGFFPPTSDPFSAAHPEWTRRLAVNPCACGGRPGWSCAQPALSGRPRCIRRPGASGTRSPATRRGRASGTSATRGRRTPRAPVPVAPPRRPPRLRHRAVGATGTDQHVQRPAVICGVGRGREAPAPARVVTRLDRSKHRPPRARGHPAG